MLSWRPFPLKYPGTDIQLEIAKAELVPEAGVRQDFSEW